MHKMLNFNSDCYGKHSVTNIVSEKEQCAIVSAHEDMNLCYNCCMPACWATYKSVWTRSLSTTELRKVTQLKQITMPHCSCLFVVSSPTVSWRPGQTVYGRLQRISILFLMHRNLRSGVIITHNGYQTFERVRCFRRQYYQWQYCWAASVTAMF